jgi:hypothetical protein
MFQRSKIKIVIILIILLAINYGQIVNAYTPLFVTNSSTEWTVSPELAVGIAKNEPNESVEMARYYQYRENMTDWQKKLDDTILELTDPDYPRSGSRPRTVDQLKQQLENRELLVSTENISGKFGVEHPTGEIIKIEISVDPSAPTTILDPYMINITGRSFHLIYGWIYVNDIKKIASLEKVRTVYLYPESSFDKGPLGHSINITNQSPDYSITSINLSDGAIPLSTQPLATHASSFPVVGTIFALSMCGIFVKIKKLV